MITGRAHFALCLLYLFVASGLGAQKSSHRDPVAFTFGALGIAAGDDRCADMTGLAGGVEARTRGTWFAAMGLDLLASWGGDCAQEVKVATYDGSQVEVRTTTELRLAPRIRLLAGGTIDPGGVLVDLAVGVGLIRVSAPDLGAFYSQWYGGTLGVRRRDLPVGVEVEYGFREVPFRYLRSGTIVHEFGQFEPLIRLGIIF